MKKQTMINKFTLLMFAIICMAGNMFAQKTCSADEHYQRLLAQYPQLAVMEEQYNNQLRQAIEARITSATDTTIYDIPLVIHVIHDYGLENIPDDTLYAAAAVWASVYMKQNADTASVISTYAGFIPNSHTRYIGNPRMRLHLATIDPNNHPTKGVVRYNSYLTQTGDDQAKFGDWPQNKYINIWFVNAFGEKDAGAAAYAYLPPTVNFIGTDYDGVICLASYANYLQGGSDDDKTVPHELGHVLNLQHPWGNTNQPATACGDDQVDDTPPTMGHNPTGCSAASLYDAACAAGYSKTYTAHSGGDSIVNYPDTVNSQNIMDYTYCQRMFTYGQAVRMRTALLSSTAGRNNLFSSSNLAATGALAPMPDLAPIADFIVNKAASSTSSTDARSYFLTINNTTALFKFQNESWNDTVSSVAWTFSNGASTPTSTSMTTVTTSFSQPGWVSVSLTANSNAGSNTITNAHAVYAADTAAIGGVGYTQNFATASGISNWPMFNYYNNQFQWQYSSAAGYDDHNSIRYRSFDTSGKRTGSPVGDHDDFYTPAFDLTNSPATLYLSFYTAGASVATSAVPSGENVKGDSVEVDVSTTGGQRWNKLATYYGSDLANNGNKTTEFVPTTPSQWKERSISVISPYRTSQTFFRFRYYPGNTGNDVYFDNFSLGQWPSSVAQSITPSTPFNIFPNPATNGFNLVFKTGNDGVVNYTIKDLTGKLVYQHSATLEPNTLQQEMISRSATPSAGMYFVTVTVDGVNMTQKLVVY